MSQSGQDSGRPPGGVMGPTIEAQATFFRVWAPAAERVEVVGEFAPEPVALRPEGDGVWGGWARGARPGHTYKFRLHTGSGEVLERNDPYARAVTSSAGSSVLVDPRIDWGTTPFEMPPWNELVIYELHVGTFHAKSADAPGTFHSVIERLGYLTSLGINAIELMPSTEFPGARSWGYNPSYPFALESDYGGRDGFLDLVRAAHGDGVAVILDVVYNHFGPDDLDLWRFDGWSENGGGGIYFYNDWRAETPWGHTRPDYGRPEVRRYILDNARMWLDDYRVDGLRTDALAYVRNVHGGDDPGAHLADGRSLMQELNAHRAAHTPWKITIAEDLRGAHDVTQPVDQGGEGFGSQWDARFVNVLRRQLTAPTDEQRSMAELAEIVADRYNDDPFQRVIYSESHDDVANGKERVAEEIAPGHVDSLFSRKRAALGLATVLTSPGIPMLFQGQAMHAAGHFSDVEPLDWSLPEAHRGQVALTRDLIHLRRNLRSTTRGLTGPHVQIVRADDEHKLLVYRRWRDGGPLDDTLVVLNFSAHTFTDVPLGLPAAGRWVVRFNSDWTGYWPDFAGVPVFDLHAEPGDCDGLPFVGRLHVPPYTALILSLDDASPASVAAPPSSLGGLPPLSFSPRSRGAAPSSATPSSFSPFSTVPSSAMPSSAMPSSTTPSAAAPGSSVPSSAVPSSVGPSSVGPSSAQPSSATPSSPDPFPRTSRTPS